MPVQHQSNKIPVVDDDPVLSKLLQRYLEAVFLPFHRLESSRSRITGGGGTDARLEFPLKPEKGDGQKN